MNKDVVTLLHAGSDNQGSVTRWRRHEEAGSINKRPAFRSREKCHLLGLDFGSVGTLASSKHAGPNGEFGVLRARRCGENHTGELGTRYPWECYNIWLAYELECKPGAKKEALRG